MSSRGAVADDALLFSSSGPNYQGTDETIRPAEVIMKAIYAIIAAALIIVSGCANTQNMTPEELEAIRQSNERYERSKGP